MTLLVLCKVGRVNFSVWSWTLLACGALSVDAARAQSTRHDASGATDQRSARGLYPERPMTLMWTAPVGCPDETAVERELQRLLAQSSERDAIDVRVVVTRGSDELYTLTIDLRAPVEGHRALEHRDCGAVTRAAALVVALSIDADAVAEVDSGTSGAVEPEPESVTVKRSRQQAQAVKPQAVPAVEVRDDQPPASEPSNPFETAAPHVSLGAYVDATFAPNAAWGPSVSAGVGNQWLLLELVVGGIPSYVVTRPGTGIGAAFEIFMAEANACGGMLGGVLNVALCVTGRQYWIRATGRGVDEVLKPTTAVFAMAVGPLLAIELGSWRLFTLVEGVAPLARPSFVVDNLDVAVLRPPTVGLSGRLGLSLTL